MLVLGHVGLFCLWLNYDEFATGEFFDNSGPFGPHGAASQDNNLHKYEKSLSLNGLQPILAYTTLLLGNPASIPGSALINRARKQL
jgi:hypothetical protein